MFIPKAISSTQPILKNEKKNKETTYMIAFMTNKLTKL